MSAFAPKATTYCAATKCRDGPKVEIREVFRTAWVRTEGLVGIPKILYAPAMVLLRNMLTGLLALALSPAYRTRCGDGPSIAESYCHKR